MTRLLLILLALSCCSVAEARRRWVPRVASAATNDFLTNLVGYYELNESANADAVDASGNGKTMTDFGSVGSVSGVISTARSFPGTGGNYLRRNSDSSFQPGASSFSITLWAKPASLTQGTFPTIVGYAKTLNIEWMVNFYDGNAAPYFSVSANGVTEVQAVAATNSFPNTSTWVFIACTWDGTNIKISVNGGSFVTAAFAGPVFSGTSDFEMGTRGAAGLWNGAIDEVAFWKGRSLTLAEVQQIYNAGAGLPFSSFQ